MSILQNEFTNIKNLRDGTPAYAIIRFFFAWKNRDINMMLNCCQKTWKSKPMAKEKLELWFGDLFLVGMKIKKITYINTCCYGIIMQFGMKKRGQSKSVVGLLTGRVLCEKAPYLPDVNGEWGLNPLSLLKGIGVYKKIFINSEEL